MTALLSEVPLFSACLPWIGHHWKGLIQVLTPLICSLVFLYESESEAMKCAFVLLVMATYWVFEVMPVAVTSLIPIAAFPLLGLMSTVRSIQGQFDLNEYFPTS